MLEWRHLERWAGIGIVSLAARLWRAAPKRSYPSAVLSEPELRSPVQILMESSWTPDVPLCVIAHLIESH